MPEYKKGFWHSATYLAPTAEKLKLWRKNFNSIYPLSPATDADTPCPSVYKDSTGTFYCTRKAGHDGVHRTKDFLNLTPKTPCETLAVWETDQEVGLRGEVVALQDVSGLYYDDPCHSTVDLVGADKVRYVFRCESENGHSGKHHSEPEKDAVPGYLFKEPNHVVYWDSTGKLTFKPETKKSSGADFKANQVYFAPVGSHMPTSPSVFVENSSADLDFNTIGHTVENATMPNSFKTSIQFSSNLTSPLAPAKCLKSIDGKNFCVKDAKHAGHHEGNDFGWYDDYKKVVTIQQRSKLIYKAAQLKKDPGLPPEVAHVMQEIIDYLNP